MDFSVWKTACRFCGRLAETDEPKECQEHFKSHGHYPNGVQRYQVPGQRARARFGPMWPAALSRCKAVLPRIARSAVSLIGTNPGCAFPVSIQSRIFEKSGSGKPPHRRNGGEEGDVG